MSAPQQQLNRLVTEKEKLTKELERTRGIIKVSQACEVCRHVSFFDSNWILHVH